MAFLLGRVTVANRNGEAKDAMSVSVTAAGGLDPATDGAAFAAALQDLFNASTLGHPNLGHYLATCLESTADIKVYDLNGHLDGSPHGSPVFELPAAAISNGGADSRGNVMAICVSYHADLSLVPENGPVGVIPTPEIGRDWGAPVTHPGVTKPRASRRGRFFLGPLSPAVFDVDGNFNPKISDGTLTDVAGVMTDWAGTDLPSRGLGLTVWSRRLAAMHTVTGGWVDRGIKTVRRREYRPGTRELWAI